MSKKSKVGVIYSTNPDFGYQYDGEDEALTLEPNKQDLRVMRDSKQRAGKTVTLIKGFVGQSEDLEALSKQIKTKCGVGGSVKDGEIVLQGDVRDKVCDFLDKAAYRYKRAGG